MIIKERKKPVKIPMLEALIRRLPSSHPQIQSIEKELAKRKAGFRGEQALDYYLEYLPSEDYYLFHDVRLHDRIHYFQIDTLLVTPYFLLIVGVKNIAGKISFNQNLPQMVRLLDGREDGFQDPFTQGEWHQNSLSRWLYINDFPFVPIDYLVVISNPTTIIETSEYIPKKLTHNSNLLFKIEELAKFFTERHLTENQVKRLCTALNEQHTPHKPDVMKQFGITEDELLSGVFCEKCKTLTMERTHGRWVCRNCGSISRTAHIQAFEDYKLLMNDTISNRELREFLKLSSSKIARDLLKSMLNESNGNTKGRRYHIPY